MVMEQESREEEDIRLVFLRVWRDGGRLRRKTTILVQSL